MFIGSKFYCSGTKMVRDNWDNLVEKPTFRMTKEYSKYLKAKELEKKNFEIRQLKAKLDYQFRTYGEVEYIDVKRYIHLLETY